MSKRIIIAIAAAALVVLAMSAIVKEIKCMDRKPLHLQEYVPSV